MWKCSEIAHHHRRLPEIKLSKVGVRLKFTKCYWKLPHNYLCKGAEILERYKHPLGKQLIYDSYELLLDSWGTKYEERDVDTAYGLTHVITAGDPQSPPLLLFHGTADNSAMMWIYNVKVLSEKFYIIAVDAIGGSGKSEPNTHYYKSFNQVTWIDDL